MPARRGRPPLDINDPSVRLTVALTGRQFDDVFRLAQREKVTMPEVVRRLLDQRTRQRPDDDDD